MNESEQKLDFQHQQQMLFMMLVQQHSHIALMSLGKEKNTSDQSVTIDLTSARYAIDTLVMLEEYTQNNIPEAAKKYLTDTLTHLRLTYAQVSDSQPSTPEKKD